MISSPERALLECLYLTPNHFDMVECYQVLEGLSNLRPKVLHRLITIIYSGVGLTEMC
ncbi:MAG: type IV toxin-antitoxin system AbiEi family antitoxin domain-containing protein [Bacteroidales bacterium]|nr:type IV toxin-antitoxin system AbiEi family antitoxin domain-containing protein [Bacteroidales bacterium]